MFDLSFYRRYTQAVSVEDFKLGMHVGNQASIDRFPMKAPSAFSLESARENVVKNAIGYGMTPFAAEAAIQSLDRKGLLDPDTPHLKAMFGIKAAFPINGLAITTRIIAMAELTQKPGMEKWIVPRPEESGGGFLYADAVMEVAASFPFRRGSLSFNRKAFLREVQRVADARYGGQFT
jgi:hypothetical protein